MHTEKIRYKEGDQEFEGVLAYDDTLKGERPAVLVGHAWVGRDAFAEENALALAKLGYVAFAWDLYGEGHQCADHDEMYALLEDRPLLRRRLLAALNTMKTLPMVDAQRMAAMGFCFGGLSSLDLARMGTDLKGVISFHGALHKPANLPNQPVTSKILVLHGHDDPMIPPQAVIDFEKEMVESQVEDWQVHVFGNAYHGFMIPSYNQPEKGMAYDKRAAKRAWQMMTEFLKECFA